MASKDVAEKAQAADLSREVNRMAVDEMDLAGISTLSGFRDILAAEDVKVEVYDDVYSSGFVVAQPTDMEKLVERPVLVAQWRFTESKKFFDDEGNPVVFVSAQIVTVKDDGETVDGKWIINDGGVGIARTLRRITDQRIKSNHPQPQAGLVVKHGLRKSEYETPKRVFNEATGEVEDRMVHGVTWYFA